MGFEPTGSLYSKGFSSATPTTQFVILVTTVHGTGAVLPDRWLEELAQLVSSHSRIAQDPRQGPSFELTVQGHDQW